MLQGVEADEHRIRRNEQVVIPADACALPGEFHRVDEDESGRCSSVAFVERDGVRCETDDVGKRRRVSVIVDGESSSAGAVVTKAKYRRVWWPIVTVMRGVIDR